MYCINAIDVIIIIAMSVLSNTAGKRSHVAFLFLLGYRVGDLLTPKKNCFCACI